MRKLRDKGLYMAGLSLLFPISIHLNSFIESLKMDDIRERQKQEQLEKIWQEEAWKLKIVGSENYRDVFVGYD